MIKQLLEKRLDMVVANRVEREQASYRIGHRTGNKLLTGSVGLISVRISKICCLAIVCFLAVSSNRFRYCRRIRN